MSAPYTPEWLPQAQKWRKGFDLPHRYRMENGKRVVA